MSAYRVALMAVLFATQGCTRGSTVANAGPSEKPVVVELNESTTSATARVGEQLRLTLAETPTTGYRWRLDDGCAAHLHLQNEQTALPDGPPGAPGRHEWTFVATSPGQCLLKLQSARAWESGPASGRSLSFGVRITAA